ncbi:HdeD family acid-resistance protein [Sorangium sp. So ce1335]|uniref:HdeD family acid-resistance protein n=1 Tax=Sorangium sp. So ce1335 TaxID=3133335 RepID=UPI003F6382FD
MRRTTEAWWLLVLRGIAALGLGLLTLLLPGHGLSALAVVFGAYLAVEALIALVGAARGARLDQRWQGRAAHGLISLAGGIVILAWPGLSVLILLYLVAAWAIVSGARDIVEAVRFRQRVASEWLLAFAGVIAVALGVLVMALPSAGALALVSWVGAYAMILGASLLLSGVAMRAYQRRAPRYAVLDGLERRLRFRAARPPELRAARPPEGVFSARGGGPAELA